MTITITPELITAFVGICGALIMVALTITTIRNILRK